MAIKPTSTRSTRELIISILPQMWREHIVETEGLPVNVFVIKSSESKSNGLPKVTKYCRITDTSISHAYKKIFIIKQGADYDWAGTQLNSKKKNDNIVINRIIAEHAATMPKFTINEVKNLAKGENLSNAEFDNYYKHITTYLIPRHILTVDNGTYQLTPFALRRLKKFGYLNTPGTTSDDSSLKTPGKHKNSAPISNEIQYKYVPPNQKIYVQRLILNRQQQPEFRRAILAKYQSLCCISDCTTTSALEAAHILPFNESLNNDPENGLLLRADLHILFDLYLIRIDPNSLIITIAPEVVQDYSQYQGLKLPHNLSPKTKQYLAEKYKSVPKFD